jgi:single-strand DNA-binding protein
LYELIKTNKMSVNKAILLGRVGATPELKNLDGGNKVTNFSMATSEHFKDKAGVKQTKTEWHNVVAWGPLAEIIAKNVVKGSEIYIEGKIQNRSYEDKDGVKKYTSEVVAMEMKFVGSKKTEEGSEEGAQTEASKTTAKTASKTPAKSTEKAAVAAHVSAEDNENDLPF